MFPRRGGCENVKSEWWRQDQSPSSFLRHLIRSGIWTDLAVGWCGMHGDGGVWWAVGKRKMDGWWLGFGDSESMDAVRIVRACVRYVPQPCTRSSKVGQPQLAMEAQHVLAIAVSIRKLIIPSPPSRYRPLKFTVTDRGSWSSQRRIDVGDETLYDGAVASIGSARATRTFLRSESAEAGWCR